jgi:ethanolamine transporter
MTIDRLILFVMLFFMAIGIVDKLFLGNKYGYGEKFEEGMMAMGTLALSMVGIMSLAPVLGKLLEAPVGVIFAAVGADPAMFAGSILAIDMGGLPLARALTENPQIVQLSGIYMGAMMGATVVFSIPVSLGIVEESDRPYLAKGMLAGFVSIPFGAFVSGIIGGIPAGVIIINLIPSIVLALLFALGLAFIPDKMMTGFNVFSKFITIVIILALGAAIARHLGGITIPGLEGMDDIGPQLETCGIIAITLAGAFPFVHFVTTVLGKPLSAVGKLIGVNDVAAAGIIACLANNIPMFGMMKDMDEKGKVFAVAFSVCASFALGDHLGFTAGVDQSAIFPMIAGKVVGGAVGILIAALLVVRSPKKASAR